MRESTLRKYAELAGVKQFELFPGKEYPTPFTRLPLLSQRSAGRRGQRNRRQLAIRTSSNSKAAGTKAASIGLGHLTVYDEDFLSGCCTCGRWASRAIVEHAEQADRQGAECASIHQRRPGQRPLWLLRCLSSKPSFAVNRHPRKGGQVADIALRRSLSNGSVLPSSSL